MPEHLCLKLGKISAACIFLQDEVSERVDALNVVVQVDLPRYLFAATENPIFIPNRPSHSSFLGASTCFYTPSFPSFNAGRLGSGEFS